MDLLGRAAESAERALERTAADVRWTSQGAYRYLRAPPCYAPDLTEPPSTRALAVLAIALVGAGGAGGSTECGAGTLGLVAVNLAWFFRPGGTDLRAVALQPYAVLERPPREAVTRLLLSAFIHSDAEHLISNMASLLSAGPAIEAAAGGGSEGASALLHAAAITLPLAHALYVGSAWAERRWYGRSAAYHRDGGVGFSSVGCALAVIAANSGSSGVGSSVGLPPEIMPVVQVAVGHLVYPRASLRAHVCGLAAGFMFVYAPKVFRAFRRRLARRGWRGRGRRLGGE